MALAFRFFLFCVVFAAFCIYCIATFIKWIVEGRFKTDPLGIFSRTMKAVVVTFVLIVTICLIP